MKLLTQLFLVSLILVKIVLGSVFIYRAEFNPLTLEKDAMASEEVQEESLDTEDTGQNLAYEAEIDLELFLSRQSELQRQAEELERKRAELLAVQEELTKKLATLTELRNEIRAMMAEREAADEAKMRHLIKAYSAMKPQRAASLVEQLDTAFAIQLLSHMKGELVGDILSFVKVEKAARISQGLALRK
jgi:flagellar motility protein MotE (MotC chaperone)